MSDTGALGILLVCFLFPVLAMALTAWALSPREDKRLKAFREKVLDDFMKDEGV